ncbi:hypothetical protein INS49_010516 [Diaporthe citri]|uniref:uncharacterized protein n=1 Tax=Diaporthe citri TaxID=83186 RepID=UPI001C80F9F0|nr:uncharacterized protein INS49_010516 [Diaporthe citri]KAG6362286.1 hypothetical protein INS49_010516 [Diaporthe citri]
MSTGMTLLFAPFIPLIVVFCQVIETQDRADLDRIGAFFTSIQPAAASSDAAAKLHRLFQVLHDAAARYVELSSGYGGGQPRATEERGMYLRLLRAQSPGESSGGDQHRQGLAHDLGGNLVQGVGVGGVSATSEEHAPPMLMNPMMRMSHGARLEEWFYSNQALMESFQTFSHDFPTEEEPAT